VAPLPPLGALLTLLLCVRAASAVPAHVRQLSCGHVLATESPGAVGLLDISNHQLLTSRPPATGGRFRALVTSPGAGRQTHA